MAHTERKRRREPSPQQVAVDVEAPIAINITDYVVNRAQEIEALAKAVKTHSGNKTALQLLPKPLRRRAASHNIKRLPRRIREVARRMMEKCTPVKTKRPSRKHRRRPNNLLEEYTRRARNHTWLETHIWHAKRFKMVEQWGYKMPLHPNDKGVRSAYRSTAKYCLLQDISYFICLELQGPQTAILQGLEELTSTETGDGFRDKASLDGSKEGYTIMYRKTQYPFGALSYVSFLWKPKNNEMDDHDMNTEDRILWIWVHPGCYSDVFNEILKVFGMKKVSEACNKISTDTNFDIPSNPKQAKLDEDHDKSYTVNESELRQGNPVFSNDNVTLISLKDKLCRFKLTGPLSLAITCNTFIGANVENISNETISNKLWWQDVYADNDMAAMHEKQKELWDRMPTSTTVLPDYSVIGFTVRDPRILLPQKKTKVSPDVQDVPDESTHNIPERISYSPIWEDKVRSQVKDTKIAEAKLNELRNKQLLPGTELNLGNEESRIPVLLIQNPGSKPTVDSPTQKGHGIGCDIILPAGWAMPFWIAMVYRGARVGGLRESESHVREQKNLKFPDDYPDTPSAMESSNSIKKNLLEKYNRKPTAKKPNFVKLGMPYPFCSPWKKLFENSNGSNVDKDIKFYVIRDKSILKKLAMLPSEHSSLEQEYVDALIDERKQALVPVYVDMLHRGTPEMFACICIPSLKDLRNLEEDESFGGPCEPRHQDTRQKKPKVSKNRRKRPKKKKTDDNISNKKEENSNCSFIADEDFEIGSHCSRQIFGFVNRGGFSYTVAHGGGIGFVTCADYVRYCYQMQKNPFIVLIRNTTSFQYRYATISVITDL